MLDKYPKLVKQQTRVTIEDGYDGKCEFDGYIARVTTAQYLLAHEMGHATAKILGIEQELANLVWNTPGSEKETNDNIFCYGAQQRAKGNIEHAKAEYAADAIQAYTEGWELPEHIRKYIESKWK